RYGSPSVVIIGGFLLDAGVAAAPFIPSETGRVVNSGILMAARGGAGSFSILIGATAQNLPPERRAFAAGFINAGGSFGQFVFAPLNQALIALFGWVNALIAMGAIALSTLPLARLLPAPQHSSGSAHAEPTAAGESSHGLRAQLAAAWRDSSYWCLHAGFF